MQDSDPSGVSPRGKRRRKEDTLSSLPRKSFQITMTGGIVYQGSSCATLMSEPGKNGVEGYSDEDDLSPNNSSHHNDNNHTPPKQKEKEAHKRFPKVWKHMDEEGALMMEPEASTTSRLNNMSTDSTMESSVEEFGELVSDHPKDHKEEDKIFDRFDRKKFFVLLVVFFGILLVAITIPTAVVAISKEEIATPAPTESMSPSITPSQSIMPSDQPSLVPTSSQIPSDMPSQVPSTVPSTTPTDTFQPSDQPSSNPSLSLVPSLTPSSEPSASPTKLPSTVPSVSMEPTFTPIDPNWRFKLRLYWSPEYFWQEETEERFWCLECVPCEEYGRDDGWKHGCEAYPDGLNRNCKVGDSVWIRDCRQYGNEYNVLQKHKAGFTLRLHNTNLCIERSNKHLMMKRCDINDHKQQFVAWDDFSKFELIPLEHQGRGEREADCVSQLHHPKSEEVVGMHNCRLCRHFETRYWEVYK